MLRALRSLSSYWEVRLGDGRLVTELQTDWDHLDPDRRAIRLHTPKGTTPWLVGPCFQLKAAVVSTRGRETLGHLIGALTGDDGTCICYAWNHQTVLGPFYDNVNNLRYEGLGPVNRAAVGI